MKAAEIIRKVLSFGIVAAVIIVCGVAVLESNHADTDAVQSVLGWGMVGFGGIVALFGVGAIAASYSDLRAQRRAAQLHITPRSGPPTTPPPWGMGDIGRPGVMRVDRMVGQNPAGRGGVRVVGLTMRHLDVPIVLGFLVLWTVVALLLLAPR